MTSRSRSEDLAADLLQDIAAEQAHEPAAGSSHPSNAQPDQHEPGAAFVDTELFFAPSRWKRPGIARAAHSLAISAGPVRVRLGRRTR